MRHPSKSCPAHLKPVLKATLVELIKLVEQGGKRSVYICFTVGALRSNHCCKFSPAEISEAQSFIDGCLDCPPNKFGLSYALEDWLDNHKVEGFPKQYMLADGLQLCQQSFYARSAFANQARIEWLKFLIGEDSETSPS